MAASMTLSRIFSLARVPNIPTVWSNCLAAWVVAGAVPDWRLLPLLTGASLLYAGGCTLNDAFDAEWDRANRPERLIPSGAMTRGAVLRLGFGELLSGTAILAVLAGKWAALPVLLALCILIYDRWHKQNPLSVITMAACRWLLWLTAGAIGLQHFPDAPMFHAAAASVFFWIISISIIARREAQASPERKSESAFIILIIPVILGITSVVNAGLFAGAQAGIAESGVILLGLCLFGFAMTGRKRNWGPGDWVVRMLAGIPLLDAALVLIGGALSARACLAAALCVVCFFLAAKLQRRWAAS